VGGRSPLPDALEGEYRTCGDGLFVDLIPDSCWFTNVRSCVSQRDWDRLRRMMYRRAYDKCEVCGAGRDPDVGKWLEGHERGEYDDVTRTQRLKRDDRVPESSHWPESDFTPGLLAEEQPAGQAQTFADHQVQPRWSCLAEQARRQSTDPHRCCHQRCADGAQVQRSGGIKRGRPGRRPPRRAWQSIVVSRTA